MQVRRGSRDYAQKISLGGAKVLPREAEPQTASLDVGDLLPSFDLSPTATIKIVVR
jgi:hypothetical protein